MRRSPSILLALILLHCISHSAANEITTDHGIIRGERINVAARQMPAIIQVCFTHTTIPLQYLGVPTGAAPTGDNRFAMPLSAARWTHTTKDATRLGKVCMQQPPPFTADVVCLECSSATLFSRRFAQCPSRPSKRKSTSADTSRIARVKTASI